MDRTGRTPSGPRQVFSPQSPYLTTLVVWLAISVATLSSNVASPLYGVYQQRWGFSSTALTGIFAVYAVGVLAAMLLVGPLSDRIGRRPVMLPSLGIVALGGVVFCFAQDLRWLVAARVLAGVGTGALVGAASAALVDVDPAGNRQRASMLGTIGFTAGAAVGPTLAAASLHYSLWPTRLPFLAVAALAGVTAFTLRRVPWPCVERRPEAFRLSEWRPQRVSVPREMVGPFLLAAAALALSWSVGALFAAMGPTFATQLLGIRSRALAGLVVVGFQICGGVAQLFSGALPPRRTLFLGPLVMIAGLLACLGSISYVLPALFIAGTLTTALGFGAMFVGAAAVVNRAAPPERRGEVVSALYITGYLTMCLPVLAVGVSSDVLGLKPTFTLFTALISLASLVVALVSLRKA